MARHASASLPTSAPDLVGPTSILDWPTTFTPTRRARGTRALSHARLEIDLHPEVVREPALPLLRQMETLLREREVVEIGDLLRLTAGLLHGLASLGFQRVDHWEVAPGGWLPLPEPAHEQLSEPVGHLLRALKSDAWKKISGAREFAVRLSGTAPYRADATIRRIHRERSPSATLELRGRLTSRDVRDVVDALAERLPVVRSRVGAFAYA